MARPRRQIEQRVRRAQRSQAQRVWSAESRKTHDFRVQSEFDRLARATLRHCDCGQPAGAKNAPRGKEAVGANAVLRATLPHLAHVGEAVMALSLEAGLGE